MRDRALVIIAALVGALLVWVIARLLVADPLMVERGNGDGTITIGPIEAIVATLIGGLLAWAALAALERFTRQASRIWLILAVVVLALTMLALGQAMGTETAIALSALHLAVGVVLIVGLLRTVTSQRA